MCLTCLQLDQKSAAKAAVRPTDYQESEYSTVITPAPSRTSAEPADGKTPLQGDHNAQTTDNQESEYCTVIAPTGAHAQVVKVDRKASLPGSMPEKAAHQETTDENSNYLGSASQANQQEAIDESNTTNSTSQLKEQPMPSDESNLKSSEETSTPQIADRPQQQGNELNSSVNSASDSKEKSRKR